MLLQLSVKDILGPAIELATTGVPIAPICAYFWNRGAAVLQQDLIDNHGEDLLLNGKAPAAGDVMKMPLLAETFQVSLIQRGSIRLYEQSAEKFPYS